MMQRLKRTGGFSLIEVVLALVISAMVVGVTTEGMLNSVDSYSFIANRKSALGDVRYAMNRISEDMLRVNSGDITTTNATEIRFTDETAAATSYRLATNGSGLGVFRGADLMVDKVSAFTVAYYDGNGNVLDPTLGGTPSNTRRVKFTITTAPVSGEGSVTLTSTVTPREFLGYNNYQ